MNIHEFERLGLNLKGASVELVQLDIMSDVSPYEYMLKDELTSEYNGNRCFTITIYSRDKASEIHFKINGWTLKKLAFPGNWYGEWGVATLVDRLGNEYEYHCKEQGNHSKEMLLDLRTSFANIIKFTKENYTLEHYYIREKYSIYGFSGVRREEKEDYFNHQTCWETKFEAPRFKDGKISISDFYQYVIADTYLFMSRYMKLRKLQDRLYPKKDEQLDNVIEECTQKVKDIIKDGFGYELLD